MTRSARAIIADVAQAFGVDPSDIRGPSQAMRATRPRFAAYRIIKDKGLSNRQVAWATGRTHPSTVLLGLRRANELLVSDPVFAARFEEARGG